MNITFGRGGDETLMLDMFLPEAQAGPLPVLMFIHGGGWCEGNRGYMHEHAIDAAKNGFAAVSVSYRLAAQTDGGSAINQFPVQIHDVKCAVRWLRAHAEKYNFDPDRIAVSGHSAGGHLALMLATTAGDEFFEGDGGWGEYSSDVQAAVSWAGSTEIVSVYPTTREDMRPFVLKFLGGGPEEFPEKYKAASPVSHISDKTAPILFVHGSEDDIVPAGQSLIMRNKLEEAGLENELLILEGQAHGYDEKAMQQIRQTQYAFLRKYLK